ncbi:hypothetical protein [Natronolimnohabitans innermongolicus]|uniref:Uncharacterized protein n=1 Tax=Natronolimnohabitans innermongolicus JCM 12255 TaxID=1227499 RepID=L9WVR3_9EURY|nr:hypothetical protein [Natronolimnohabitans innermongolicus]ELY53291.1 hypothetical protein C493_14713 [Natronolimnohabitans innermongolicus JCM 12255]
MPQFERRVSLAVGLLFLGAFGWSLWNSLEVILDGMDSTTTIVTLAGGVLMLLGGIAFLVAGVVDGVSVAGRPLEWWQLQSVGYVAIGLYMALTGVVQSPLSVVGALSLLGGAGIVVFGVVRARTGPPTEENDAGDDPTPT